MRLVSVSTNPLAAPPPLFWFETCYVLGINAEHVLKREGDSIITGGRGCRRARSVRVRKSEGSALATMALNQLNTLTAHYPLISSLLPCLLA
jgi:hypothetical protein